MHTKNIKLATTLREALDLQSACMFAALMYEREAKSYAEGDDLREYYEKRVIECQASANLVHDAIMRPGWDAQLEVIHECSLQDKWRD